MAKWIFSLCMFFCVGTVMAHKTDASMTMLVEQKDGSWLLQVKAALTAFQYEVIAQHGEGAYDSPEKFKELVISHLKKNISIHFNGGVPVTLQDARVKLGHESNVVFRVIGVPDSFKTISVQNSSFKDIHRNQSALLVLKEGYAKKQFVLSGENNHMVELLVGDAKFVAQGKTVKAVVGSPFSKWGIVGVLAAGILVLLFFYFKKR